MVAHLEWPVTVQLTCRLCIAELTGCVKPNSHQSMGAASFLASSLMACTRRLPDSLDFMVVHTTVVSKYTAFYKCSSTTSHEPQCAISDWRGFLSIIN